MRKKTFHKHLPITAVILLLQSIALSETVPELLIRHRDAIGTAETLEGISMMSVQSHLSMLILEGTATTVLVAPDKVRTEIITPVMRFVEASDGLSRWKQDQNNQITRRDESQKLDSYAMVLPDFQYLFSNPSITVTDDGTKLIDDIEYRILQIDAPGYKKPRVLYLDPQTFLCVREETEQEGISVTISHSEFTTVNGFTFPKKSVQQAMIPGMPPTTLTLTDIRFNEPVDMAIFEMPQDELPDFTFPESNQVTVPLTVKGEHLLIDVALNNSEPALFMLDSGAGTIIIDDAFADELKLERAGGMHVIGVGGAEAIDKIDVDTVSIGDFHIHNLAIFCMDMTQISEMLGVEDRLKGIIGYDLFARAVMELDYSAGKLRMIHPDHFEYDGRGSVLQGEIINNLICVDGVIDGVIEGKLRLDTGAAGGLHLHAGPLRKLGLMDNYKGLAELTMTGAGGNASRHLVLVNSLALGDFTVRNPLSTLNIGESNSIFDTLEAVATVGNQVLSQFDVYFDFPNSRVILEPLSPALRVSADQSNRAGLLVVSDDDETIVVGRVVLGSPADEAGFLAGDQIIQIAKLKPGKGLTIDTVNQLLNAPEGVTYRTRVLRKGQLKRLKLRM